jgi:MFS family permease
MPGGICHAGRRESEKPMMQGQSLRTQIGVLVIATSLIQLANGFFGTFVSLRVAVESFDTPCLVLSAYFAGFTLGALRCSRIIGRVGHIRAYAAFAGLVAAAAAVMPLLIGSLAWVILRGIVGFGCAGIFVTTESWLTAKARPSERGRVFSAYMVGTFLALALGQLLIARADVEAPSAFNAIAALFALALIIVTTARAEPPSVRAEAGLPYGVLTRAAPIAVLGSALSGLVGGCFYALVPAWMQDQGVPRITIALFMLVAVLGGFAFQIPVGRLSDRFDRRIVLALLSLGFAGTAFVMVLLPRSLPAILPAAVLLGGFMSVLYPVCVAHAHDRMPADRVVAVSGRLILVSGIGSVLGPLIGATLMTRFEIDGVFYFMAAAVLLLALMAGLRGITTQPPKRLAVPFEILTPQAGLLAHDPFDTSSEPLPAQ